MKLLKIEEMEMINGGRMPSQRQCALAGVGIAGTFAAGAIIPAFWGVTTVLIVGYADCF